MNLPSSSQCSDFCTEGGASHQHMCDALAAIQAAPVCSGALRRRWAYFEDGILQRVRAAEELLLPAFELAHPHDATGLRSDYQHLRALLAAAAGGLGNKSLDLVTLAELATLLKRTGSTEERCLFPWAQRCLPVRKRAEFQQRLRSHLSLGQVA